MDLNGNSRLRLTVFSAEPESEKRLEEQTGITIGARSTAILVGEQKTGKENKVGVLL